MENEALRLIERLECALLVEHECYSDRGWVCTVCNLCKEACEFLAAHPKIATDNIERSLKNCSLFAARELQRAKKRSDEPMQEAWRTILRFCTEGGQGPSLLRDAEPTEPPIEISEEEWARMVNHLCNCEECRNSPLHRKSAPTAPSRRGGEWLQQRKSKNEGMRARKWIARKCNPGS